MLNSATKMVHLCMLGLTDWTVAPLWIRSNLATSFFITADIQLNDHLFIHLIKNRRASISVDIYSFNPLENSQRTPAWGYLRVERVLTS